MNDPRVEIGAHTEFLKGGQAPKAIDLTAGE